MENHDNEINELEKWERIDNKLCRKFKFKDFVEAFGFITRIALEAEKMDHHPDIMISYNNVDIKLITHQTNSITEKDLVLAKKINVLLE